MKNKIKQIYQQVNMHPFPEGVSNCHGNEIYRFAQELIEECVRIARQADNEDEIYAAFAIEQHFKKELCD